VLLGNRSPFINYNIKRNADADSSPHSETLKCSVACSCFLRFFFGLRRLHQREWMFDHALVNSSYTLCAFRIPVVAEIKVVTHHENNGL